MIWNGTEVGSESCQRRGTSPYLSPIGGDICIVPWKSNNFPSSPNPARNGCPLFGFSKWDDLMGGNGWVSIFQVQVWALANSLTLGKPFNLWDFCLLICVMRIMPTYLSELILGLEMIHVKFLSDSQLLKGRDYPCLVFLTTKHVALDWI